MLLRFYPAYTLESIRKLTFTQFNILYTDARKIIKMESGEEDKKKNAATGKAGAAMAKAMFPRG